MSKTIFIYGLAHPVSGELRYIGKTVNPRRRLWEHIKEAEAGVRTFKHRWIRGLLKKGLKPTLIVLDTADTETWQITEQKWIAHYRELGARLTNLTEGGDGLVGYVPSEETRRKNSEAWHRSPRLPPSWKGKTQSSEHVRQRVEARKLKGNYAHSDETKRKMSQSKIGTQVGENNPFYGRKHSDESLRKMSEIHSGRPAWNKGVPCSEEVKQAISVKNSGRRPSEETRKKMSAANKGRKMSPEFSEKLRQANLGKHHSEETKEKLRRANLGKQHSEETKEKLREIFTGRFVSEETRQKMSQSRKGKKMTPEQLAKRKEAQQRLWQDAEYRSRMLEAQRRRREREAEEKAESQMNP